MNFLEEHPNSAVTAGNKDVKISPELAVESLTPYTCFAMQFARLCRAPKLFVPSPCVTHDVVFILDNSLTPMSASVSSFETTPCSFHLNSWNLFAVQSHEMRTMVDGNTMDLLMQVVFRFAIRVCYAWSDVKKVFGLIKHHLDSATTCRWCPSSRGVKRNRGSRGHGTRICSSATQDFHHAVGCVPSEKNGALCLSESQQDRQG